MDIGLILVTVCGLSLVCVGTFVVVAFIVVRTTGVRLWDAFSGIGGVFGVLNSGEDDEPELANRSAARRDRRSRADLRARAQALDFDSAVARHSEEPASPTALSADTPPRQPGTRLPTERPLGGASQRRRRAEGDEDEIFGGFLDDDGDGSIDF